MVSPLISAHELRSRLEDSDIVILDCRWYINDAAQGRNVYDEAHIPGARFVRLDTDLSRGNGPGRHPLPTHEAFGETCERLGIDRSSHVVLYDDLGGAIAARMWWMLTNQGHRGVSVLDGGLDAWIAIDGPMTDEVPTVETTTLQTRPWVGTVDRYQVKNRPDTTILIDARAPERYRGDYEPIDPVAGHIPGARSIPQTGNLNPNMTFRPPDELRERYLSVGIGNAEDVITLCGSGVTACHNILAMVIAGMPGAHLYVGSWSDWSSAGMPTVVGEDPR